jgi:hypothetical protein
MRTRYAVPVFAALSVLGDAANAQAPAVTNTNAPVSVPADTPPDKVSPLPVEYVAARPVLPPAKTADPARIIASLKAELIRARAKADDFSKAFDAVMAVNNKQVLIDDLKEHNARLKAEVEKTRGELKLLAAKGNEAENKGLELETNIVRLQKQKDKQEWIAIVLFVITLVAVVALLARRANSAKQAESSADAEENESMRSEIRLLRQGLHDYSYEKTQRITAHQREIEELLKQRETEGREAEARLLAIQAELNEAKKRLAFYDDEKASPSQPSVPEQQLSFGEVGDPAGFLPAPGADPARGTVAMAAAHDPSEE